MSIITLANGGNLIYAAIGLVWKYSSPLPNITLSGARLADFSKAVMLLLGRLVYFYAFNPQAKFPGPVLAKGGEVCRRLFQNESLVSDICS